MHITDKIYIRILRSPISSPWRANVCDEGKTCVCLIHDTFMLAMEIETLSNNPWVNGREESTINMPSTSIKARDDLFITIVVVGSDVPFPIAAGATVFPTLMAGSSVSKLVRSYAAVMLVIYSWLPGLWNWESILTVLDRPNLFKNVAAAVYRRNFGSAFSSSHSQRIQCCPKSSSDTSTTGANQNFGGLAFRTPHPLCSNFTNWGSFANWISKESGPVCQHYAHVSCFRVYQNIQQAG